MVKQAILLLSFSVACSPLSGIEVRRGDSILGVLTECTRGERQSVVWATSSTITLTVGHGLDPMPAALVGVGGRGEIRGMRLWYPPEDALGVGARGSIRIGVVDAYGVEVEGAVSCEPERDSLPFTGNSQVIHNPKSE